LEEFGRAIARPSLIQGHKNTGKKLTYIQAPGGIRIHHPIFGATENTMY
jgi:hypothetical protein